MWNTKKAMLSRYFTRILQLIIWTVGSLDIFLQISYESGRKKSERGTYIPRTGTNTWYYRTTSTVNQSRASADRVVFPVNSGTTLGSQRTCHCSLSMKSSFRNFSRERNFLSFFLQKLFEKSKSRPFVKVKAHQKVSMVHETHFLHRAG